MAAVRRLPETRCPNPLHQGSIVKAWGTFTRTSGRYRRYRCQPLVGKQFHYFSVRIDTGRKRRISSGQPECLDHPASHITRAGTYGPDQKHLRQRYACHHIGRCNATCAATCSGKHVFTPPIPRAHVGSSDGCSECLELRGYHRGEMASARNHRFTARIVAWALADLSLGLSYAKAGKEALQAAEIPLAVRRRVALVTPPKSHPRTSAQKPHRRSAATQMMGRFWQIGAGFVEAFAPVIWQDVETRLRARAEAMAAAGLPRIWILDDVPIWAIDRNGKRKKTDGYSILALAEMDWMDAANPGATKLRLVRALPKSTSVAWRLLFAEMGYVPDLVLSDAATPIIGAVARHFPAPGPLFVPSTYHLGRALENHALAEALQGPDAPDLRAHLAQLGKDGAALSSVAAWHTWWDRLEALAVASNLADIGDLRRSRANYEERMAAALPALLSDPRLSQSTGGLENLIRSWVEPILHERQHQFGNIERTNNLFDLAVCRAEGALVDLNAVARLLEADALSHGGWTVPARAIADPLARHGWYRSLRDETQMTAIAEERGLL